MTKFQDKAQAQVNQVVGRMIGDDKLVLEGEEQQRTAQAHGTPEADQNEANEEAATGVRKARTKRPERIRS